MVAFTPGKLRHRITLQRRSTETDEYGQPLDMWSDLATVWCSIEPLTGREYEFANQQQSLISHRVLIRANPDIMPLPTDRLQFGDRIFQIVSVANPSELNHYLIIMCKELL